MPFAVEALSPLHIFMYLQLLLRLVGRLFSNLFRRSAAISVAMRARGFRGPQQHHVYVAGAQPTSWIGNAIALLILPLAVTGALALQ
jgi:energy-coupling factor transporter transmembrane protein EcfT